jgi:hypothetical protein
VGSFDVLFLAPTRDGDERGVDGPGHASHGLCQLVAVAARLSTVTRPTMPA